MPFSASKRWRCSAPLDSHREPASGRVHCFSTGCRTGGCRRAMMRAIALYGIVRRKRGGSLARPAPARCESVIWFEAGRLIKAPGLRNTDDEISSTSSPAASARMVWPMRTSWNMETSACFERAQILAARASSSLIEVGLGTFMAAGPSCAISVSINTAATVFSGTCGDSGTSSPFEISIQTSLMPLSRML